jgi:hypothetical protein
MRGEGSGYVPGNPYGQCVRCGLVGGLSTDFTKGIEWTGAKVCNDCHDPRPADTYPPHIGPEGMPRPDAQPRLPEVDQPKPIRPEDVDP